MATIRFKARDVRVLLEHARATKELAKLVNKKRGLILAGDEGVYLMSPANPQPRDEHGDTFVVFAEGINPEVDDEWRYNKNITWGVRDGLMVLPLDKIELSLEGRVRYLRMELTPSSDPKIINGVKRNRKVLAVKPLLTTRKLDRPPPIPRATKAEKRAQRSAASQAAWRGFRLSQSKSFKK